MTFHDGIMDQEPVIRSPRSLMRPIIPSSDVAFFIHQFSQIQRRCAYFRSGATWSGVGGFWEWILCALCATRHSAPEWQCRDATVGLWAGLGPEDINLALSQPDLPAYRLSRGRVTAGETDSMPEYETSGATQIAF